MKIKPFAIYGKQFNKIITLVIWDYSRSSAKVTAKKEYHKLKIINSWEIK